MSIRKIASIGHPILRQRARDVAEPEIGSASLERLIDDLVETMRDARGAGLAAPQIYEGIRVLVIEVKDNPRYPYKPEIPLTIVLNPVVTPISDETFENYEGCLSVPNLRGKVRRWAFVEVTGLDRQGRAFSRLAKGFTAGTFQHEVDHLDGTLFVDKITDPRTLTTWTEFEQHHSRVWLEAAKELVDRYGQ